MMKLLSNEKKTQSQQSQSQSLDILKQIALKRESGCLEITTDSVAYYLYFEQGKIVYATNTIDTFERLERYLRKLSQKNLGLTGILRSQARLQFENLEFTGNKLPPDYQAISWLVETKALPSEEIKTLGEWIIKEVLESCLLLTEFSQEFKVAKLGRVLKTFDFWTLIEEVEHNLQVWQSLTPVITSPYQRLYLGNEELIQQKNLGEKLQKLKRILIGFNFRQLSVLLQQDEVKLAQTLYSLIKEGAIILREPQPPFDKLPKLSAPKIKNLITHNPPTNLKINPPTVLPKISQPETIFNIEKSVSSTSSLSQLKIACVDDSKTILREINRLLSGHDFEVFTINDSVKALTSIIRIKPDLILLDVGMPNVDGYQLCRLLRNHRLFKSIPIVMVTGNTGVIDRAKARVVGATDYLTKPFTQSDLLKMVMRYLA